MTTIVTSFIVRGPREIVKKVVLYTKVQDDPLIYNLAFGDEDPKTGLVSDSVTTDNKDRDVVLATVANTINDFSDRYGNQFIYAKGSTPARTSLYQMGISNLKDDISTDFDIYGIIGGGRSDYISNKKTR